MIKVDRNGLELCECVSTYAGDGLFGVEHKQKQYVVNLVERTCWSRQWDLTGIPCAHVISTVLYDLGKSKDYMDSFYTIETLLAQN